MSIADTFGSRVKALRKHRGFTQEQLAERMDRSVDAISQLERGVNLPSFGTLDRLGHALEVPVREFFDEQDDDPGRSELLQKAAALLRDLPTTDLEIAVEQISVLMRRAKTSDQS